MTGDDERTGPAGMTFHSAISELVDHAVRVRGYPLADLIRDRGFAESTYLTLRGDLPDPDHAAVFDAVLSSLMAYPAAVAPNILAGRIVASVRPDPWAGIATALSCAGPHTISPEHTGVLIADALERATVRPAPDVAAEIAGEHIDAGLPLPGIGHPEFKEADPRAEALLEVARRHGVAGAAGELHASVVDAYNGRRAPRRPLPLNIDGAMARVLTELGFRPIQMYAVALISFLPGIAAHVIEEIEEGAHFRMLDPASETYSGAPPRAVPPASRGSSVRRPDG